MNGQEISIRHALLEDLPALLELFVGTVTEVCKNDHSQEQIQAWASAAEHPRRWTERLTSQHFLVAVLDGNIVGFASLEHDDHIDLFYVHKDHQRQGIAKRLYQEIEREAIRRGTSVLRSEVSSTAKKFFESMGYKTIAPQTVMIQGISIVNHQMTKSI